MHEIKDPKSAQTADECGGVRFGYSWKLLPEYRTGTPCSGPLFSHARYVQFITSVQTFDRNSASMGKIAINFDLSSVPLISSYTCLQNTFLNLSIMEVTFCPSYSNELFRTCPK